MDYGKSCTPVVHPAIGCKPLGKPYSAQKETPVGFTGVFHFRR
jgi:hypothetical protein